MEGSKLDRFKAGTERLLGRTNERLKQKMGRSSESVVAKDDKWQVNLANFNRQQVRSQFIMYLLFYGSNLRLLISNVRCC